MSLYRRAARSDNTRAAIVDALRAAGWYVFDIRQPVDLLCWKPSKGFRVLECKSPRNKAGDPRLDKRQQAQNDFIALTNTPRATSPEQAIQLLEA